MRNKDKKIDALFSKISLQDDDGAFQVLFKMFFPPLCVYAKRFINEGSDSEDIVQNVFYKLWKDRKELEIKTSMRNFLITNVRNSCIDYMRRRKVENAYRQEQAESMQEEQNEELYSYFELKDTIGVALAKLPENIRRTFEQSRFYGKPYKEIAKQSKISVKTVEAHITKALKILRAELKDYLSAIL